MLLTTERVLNMHINILRGPQTLYQ